MPTRPNEYARSCTSANCSNSRAVARMSRYVSVSISSMKLSDMARLRYASARLSAFSAIRCASEMTLLIGDISIDASIDVGINATRGFGVTVLVTAARWGFVPPSPTPPSHRKHLFFCDRPLVDRHSLMDGSLFGIDL